MKIGINNGVLSTTAKSEVLRKTKCFRCQQEIYIVTTSQGHKLPVSKNHGKIVTHSLVCPHSPLVKKEKRKNKHK